MQLTRCGRKMLQGTEQAYVAQGAVKSEDKQRTPWSYPCVEAEYLVAL